VRVCVVVFVPARLCHPHAVFHMHAPVMPRCTAIRRSIPPHLLPRIPRLQVLIVVPTQWLDTLKIPGGNGIVASCGAESDCQNGAAGWAIPTVADRPNLLDSRGPSTQIVAASGNDTLSAYRRTYWAWGLGGGAAVYNCDWSYTVGHENGTATDPQSLTTNSGAAYREHLGALSSFLNSLDLSVMQPSIDWFIIVGGSPHNYSSFGLASPALGAFKNIDACAAFIVGPTTGVTLQLRLGQGNELCNVEFVDTQTGETVTTHEGVSRDEEIPVPSGMVDVAFRVSF
jgi:hypothetical protein